MSPHDELATILGEIKRLAKKYMELTGKPLGVTGEIAEYEAARILGLGLANARQDGYDAVSAKWGRVQIKGRCVKNNAAGQKLGAIRPDKEWDHVLLVILDSSLEPTEILVAARAAILSELAKPGSKARNERGQLSFSVFRRISGPPIWAKPA